MKKESSDVYSSFEHQVVTLSVKSRRFTLVTIYRLKFSGLKFSTFLSEFQCLLENVSLIASNLLVLGDFNIHMNKKDCQQTKSFSQLIDSFGLTQHVNQATHRSGNMLDLVISRAHQSLGNLNVIDTLLSDHFNITFNIPVAKPPLPKKEINYRNLKSIDIECFSKDIQNSIMMNLETDDVDELANAYNSVLSDLINKHAPLKTKVITVHPAAPWYSDEIAAARRQRRKAERKWRQSGLTVHKQMFAAANENVITLIDIAKNSYYRDRIDSSPDSQKSLFECVNILLNNKSPMLPKSDHPQILCEEISHFFIDKIKKIRTHLENIQTQVGNYHNIENCLVDETGYLTSFEPTTEDEVRKIIMKSSSKTCCLDPLPTSILKKCLPALLPIITKIINLSFENAKVPACYKIAAVIPLLKKLLLDPEVFKNLRPVSTLPFVSKTLERVASKRLVDHKNKNSLYVKMQSAYREGHSTETALVRIENDILRAIDTGKCVFLVLLDMSAAFDTVDHNVLLKRLSDRFGIRSSTLNWVSSYLENRRQFVMVQGCKSKEQLLECNVPQGSVLGPGLFGDYCSPVADIFTKHGVEFHLYADDTQVYLSFNLDQEAEALQQLELCISEVRLWMANNYLKLNDDKTEFMILGSAHNLKKIKTTAVTVGDTKVAASSCVKNIGAKIDQHLKLDNQVATTCKGAWFNLYRISRIKKYLSDKQLKTVVQAFVISKLDQNNALLIGSPKSLTSKLQSVQNAACKLICGIKKYDHVTPSLIELHWLPIEQRVKFKVLLLCFKSMNNHGPAYLKELITPYVPSRCLRSSSSNILVVPKSKTVAYGDRAFSVAAPGLWNKLPTHFRTCDTVNSFKRQLKTFLFKEAFYL